jgi:hypothetical protein
MVRPTLSRREQMMLTLTQKPLMEKTPSIEWLELCFKATFKYHAKIACPKRNYLLVCDKLT